MGAQEKEGGLKLKLQKIKGKRESRSLITPLKRSGHNFDKMTKDDGRGRDRRGGARGIFSYEGENRPQILTKVRQ